MDAAAGHAQDLDRGGGCLQKSHPGENCAHTHRDTHGDTYAWLSLNTARVLYPRSYPDTILRSLQDFISG